MEIPSSSQVRRTNDIVYISLIGMSPLSVIPFILYDYEESICIHVVYAALCSGMLA